MAKIQPIIGDNLENTPTKHDGRSVLFVAAELLVSFLSDVILKCNS